LISTNIGQNPRCGQLQIIKKLAKI